MLINELHHPCLPPTLSQYLRAAFSLSPHNSNLIAKVAAAKNAPLSLNLTNEHFSSDGNFGINPEPKLPDMAKENDGGRSEEGLPQPNTKEWLESKQGAAVAASR